MAGGGEGVLDIEFLVGEVGCLDVARVLLGSRPQRGFGDTLRDSREQTGETYSL
jgi:hypothetical protein